MSTCVDFEAPCTSIGSCAIGAGCEVGAEWHGAALLQELSMATSAAVVQTLRAREVAFTERIAVQLQKSAIWTVISFRTYALLQALVVGVACPVAEAVVVAGVR